MIVSEKEVQQTTIQIRNASILHQIHSVYEQEPVVMAV
jgi:hypothetical protein